MSNSKIQATKPVTNTTFASKFSEPIVRPMPVSKAKMNELRAYKKDAPNSNKEMIQHVIDLYEGKKIPNFKTAENVLLRLSNTSKNKAIQERGLKDYKAVVAKYADALPTTGRLTRQIAEKQRKVGTRIGSITLILFRRANTGDAEATVNVPGMGGTVQKQSMRKTAKRIHQEISDSSAKSKRKYGDLEQFYIGSFDLRLDADEVKFLKSVENKMMRRGGTEASQEGREFNHLASLMKSKNVVFSHLMDTTGNSYLEAMYVMNLSKSDWTKDGDRIEFDPKRRKNKSTDKVAAYYRYTTTELDLSAETLKEAIAKHHYAKDECFINSLYDFYKDTLMNTKRHRNVITREIILETIGKTEDDVKEGLSILDMEPFFVKFRLQLRVFDKFYKLIHKYDPPTRNHHNRAMYCLCADGHIYTLNHDDHRLKQGLQHSASSSSASLEDEELPEVQLKVGENYITREDAEPTPAKMIDGADDLLDIIRNKAEGVKFIKLVHRQDDLVSLMFQLLEAGYSPGVNFEAGRVTALKLELNKTFIVVETQQLIKSVVDGVVVVEDEETYNNMSQAMTHMNNKLFLKSHLSYYTEEDVDILDTYRTKPICGMLKPVATDRVKQLIEIDVTKAYTAAFCDITEIPIFNEFDAFRPYNDPLTGPIEPLNLYLVESKPHPLNTQSHQLLYGKYLDSSSRPIAFKQPSFIKKVNYKQIVSELYENRISENDEHDVYIKKLVANVNFGLLEKGVNRRSAGYIFEDLAECQHYQAQHGGTIHIIQKIADNSQVYERSPLGLDDGIEEECFCTHFSFTPEGKPYYVLQLRAEKTLRNGFRYVKELLLQGHNNKLKEAYDKLTAGGVEVFSVKTDCFTIKADQENSAMEILAKDEDSIRPLAVSPFGASKIGSWRVSKRGDMTLPYENLQVKQLLKPQITHPKSTEHPVQNEWNTDELCDLFVKHRRVMVRAEFAGCGKSHACKAMEQKGFKVLFVCPTNKLVQNNRENGTTLNQFFGVGLSEDGGLTRISKFDDSPYQVIVFDEIYFASIRMLAKIKRYCELNPDKIILATGDTDQLETIDLVSDRLDYDTYMNHCIDTIFPDGVRLKENKRLKGSADKIILELFKKQIFDPDIPVETTIKKWFKTTKEIKTTHNIAFKNSTCAWVADQVRTEMMKKTSEYEVGETLVCRKYLKQKGAKLNVNFEYKIKAIDGSTFTVEDESTNTSYTLKKEDVKAHFIHSYCRTCHSYQGSSINDEITIFDSKFHYVSRKWLYTAVTRATELSKVWFYNGYQEKHNGEKAALKRYLDLKVDNYKKQDLRAKREVTENFITSEWLNEQFGKTCPGCGDCFRFDFVHGLANFPIVHSNLSADRIDCSEGHHLGNIVPSCVTCNQRKSCWD